MSKKGYWIAMVTINDLDNYPRYLAANVAAMEKYGAKLLVRGGRHTDPEGPAGDRIVMVEFDSYEKAIECYESPEYQAALKLRQEFANAHFTIVEGT